MRYLIASIGFLFTAPAWSSDAIPNEAWALKLDSMTYWNDPRNFHLGYTANLLETGLPIGFLKREKPATSDSADPNSVDKELRKAIDKNQRQESLSAQTLSKSLEGMRTDELQSSEEELDMNEQTALENVAFDFNQCAKEALVLLKQKIHADLTLKTNEYNEGQRLAAEKGLAAIKSRLQKHRGAGGLPCSSGDPILEKVLLSSDIDFVKALSALTSRTKENDQRRLRWTLYLAYNPKLDHELRQVWRLIWMRMSVQSVYSSKSLPSWKEISHQALARLAPSSRIIQTEDIDIQVHVQETRADFLNQMKKGLALMRDKNAVLQ